VRMRRERLFILALTLAAGVFTSTNTLALSEGKEGEVSSKRAAAFIERYESAQYLLSIGQLREAYSRIKKLKGAARTDEEKAMFEEATASYYFAKKDYARTERHATRAIQVNPTFSAAFRTRALVRREVGNVVGAEEDFRFALSFEGADTKSLRGLAEIYLAQGTSFEALSILERYLTVDPLDAWAQDSWAHQMASILGQQDFPLQYLHGLGSAAITRGELAAILVVELEMQQQRQKRSSGAVVAETEADGLAEANVSGGEHVQAVADTGYSAEAQSGIGEWSRASTGRVSDCEGRWFEPFVERAITAELMRPYPDATFRPDDIVRKGLLAVELHSYLLRRSGDKVRFSMEVNPDPAAPMPGSDYLTVPVSGYSDVTSLSYLWQPVNVVVRLGILEPDSESTFGVGRTLSGTEVLRVARRLAWAVRSP